MSTHKHKKVTVDQHYEQYWKLTLEYTDFNDFKFNKVLELCVKYVDDCNNQGWSSDDYHKLQAEINSYFDKADQASTRKSINQMFKLGFIDNGAKSYHFLTKQFLAEKDIEKKQNLYSRVMYDNASFERSFTKSSTRNELKFLVKTLENNKQLTKANLAAIMYCDPDSYPEGFINPKQLAEKTAWAENNKIQERKYNQVAYLYGLCRSLSGIYVGSGKNSKNIITLDPNTIIDRREIRRDGEYGRDPYLQRLFKMDLINEYKKLFSSDIVKCVLENKRFPILIASHIKPYRCCSKEEQFDCNNGLLLSQRMDYLFDKGYISFDESGHVIFSSKTKITAEEKEYISKLCLNNLIYNNVRKHYMDFHRNNVLK